MATIGLSKPYYALYANNGATVTYSGGSVLGKYTEMSIELDGNGEENVLRADNGPAETDNGIFVGGTFTCSTDDLRPAVAQVILGLATAELSGTGITTTGAQWQLYNDEQAIPYVGVGGIVKKKVENEYKYVAFVLPKVQFRNPSETATTQGETIEWQVPELVATILRDDTANHEWKRVSTFLASEAEAEAAIKSFFGIAS